MDCCLCLLTTVYWLTVISSCFAVLGTGTFQRMHAYGKLRVVADQTRADVRPVGPEEKVSLLRQVNKLVLFVEKMTVPKKWFTHFYVVANFWNGLFVVSTFLSYASYTDDQNDKYITIFSLVRILSSPFLGGYCTDITPITLHDVSSKPLPPLVDLFDVLFPLLQVQIHVAFRLYECLYVSKSSLNGRMHIFGYLIGLSFYLAVPWTIVVDTFLWRESEEALATGYGTNEKRSFYFYDICTYLASLCVFVYASHQQKKAHKILAELRAEQNCKSSFLPSSIYIPCHGFLFFEYTIKVNGT
uniref:Uncharacterized protein n=1 Tax=Aplanochytrium stocchinoi TaxID=215587 RepID=A0A6S8FL82_9STRA|mmetsp:Transcript_34740/g.42855  ORF Transcript_34740/g.42855 Transcript_34740/m.42855 type:complete len:300 (-) Transcript_34740:722-1621(-)